ncbi:MAG: hypothetical protein IPJ66_19610 [Bacteroidetes bacterium]|nr:hypothetical protein [Bacteroidota bacterium]
MIFTTDRQDFNSSALIQTPKSSMISYDQFKQRLATIRRAETRGGGGSYRNIRISGEYMLLDRESSGNQERISLRELYELYRQNEAIDTKIAGKFISGRVFSPAVAVLISAGLFDAKGKKIEKIEKVETTATVPPPPMPVRDDDELEDSNDEGRFFQALRQVIGKEELYAKSLGKHLQAGFLTLPRQIEFADLTPALSEMMKQINSVLMKDGDAGKGTLVARLDGFVYKHPVLGTRIVEFDEEQHFTPARKETLKLLQGHVQSVYIKDYLELCDNLDYFNQSVLPKHRVRLTLEQLPESFAAFQKLLVDEGVKEMGFVARKAGFLFLGGRVAQRAYYDTLRDIAHLLPNNRRLLEPIRISKYEIEKITGKKMESSSINILADAIRKVLEEKYAFVEQPEF